MLSDTDSTRLLRELSLQGPTTTCDLALLLSLPRKRIDVVVEHAITVGVVTTDARGRHHIETAAVEALIERNRDRLLGDAA